MKGVIFDLDGVICDTAHYHYLAWQELGKELDIFIDENFNETLKGVSRLESLEKILIHGDKSNNYDASQKAQLAKHKNENYLTLINNVTPNDLLPNIACFLQELRQANIKIALASASKNAPFLLNKLEISHYFDAIVDPALLKNGKPDPEIFLKAAAALKLTTDECIGIEDAALGILAIKSAGMRAVGIGDKEILNLADIVFTSTQDLDLQNLLKLGF